jgi:hypothetical protein
MFQLMYLRFTEPRADPIAFAALKSQVKGLLANRLASPDVVFDQTVNSVLSGNHPRRQPETPETVDRWDLAKSLAVLQGALRRCGQLHVRLRRQLHAGDDQAARRDVRRQPAGDTRARDVARPRNHDSDRHRRTDDREGDRAQERSGHRLLGSVRLRRRARPGDAGDDDGPAGTAVRHDPAGARRTYSIEVDPSTIKFPRSQFTLRIDWTCDPAQTATSCSACSRRFRSSATPTLTFDQVNRIRAGAAA